MAYTQSSQYGVHRQRLMKQGTGNVLSLCEIDTPIRNQVTLDYPRPNGIHLRVVHNSVVWGEKELSNLKSSTSSMPYNLNKS